MTVDRKLARHPQQRPNAQMRYTPCPGMMTLQRCSEDTLSEERSPIS